MPNQGYRSQNNDKRSYVRFKNLTPKIIDVLWISFSGEFVRYKNLQPTEFVDINTYVTHPWISIDVKTRDRMLMNGEFIFMPPECNRRLLVLIQLPLYSLRYRSLMALRDLMEKEDDVDVLELPKELANDLKLMINRRNLRLDTLIVDRGNV